MYSQTVKIQIDREIVNALLKKLKVKNLEEYINQQLKTELLK